MKFALPLLGLCAIVVATPAAAPAPKGTPFIATFDDVRGSALIPEVFAVPTPYRNLAWKALDVYADDLSAVKANTGGQTADSFQLYQVLKGSAPNITISYPDSKVKWYDLQSLYVGCVVVSQTGALPSTCSLEFTGYTTKGQIVSHICAYGGSTKVEFCDFPSTFVGLRDTVVSFVSSATLDVTTVLELDTVMGVTYQ